MILIWSAPSRIIWLISSHVAVLRDRAFIGKLDLGDADLNNELIN